MAKQHLKVNWMLSVNIPCSPPIEARCPVTSQIPALVKMLTMLHSFVLQLNGVSPGQGFGIEFLLTLQMVLCFLATTDKRRNNVDGSAPFAVGLSVVLGHLAGVSSSPFFLPQPMFFLEATQMRNGQNVFIAWL